MELPEKVKFQQWRSSELMKNMENANEGSILNSGGSVLMSSGDELTSKDYNEDSDDCNNSELYLCNLCDTRSASPLSYTDHIHTHVPIDTDTNHQKSFYCQKCKSYTINILHNCLPGSEPKSCTCGICLRHFHSMESAKIHALKCHDNTELVFCLGCYWGLASNAEFIEHISTCRVIRTSPLIHSPEMTPLHQSSVQRNNSGDEASEVIVISSEDEQLLQCPVTVKTNQRKKEFMPLSRGLIAESDTGSELSVQDISSTGGLSPPLTMTNFYINSNSSSPLPVVQFLGNSSDVQDTDSLPSTEQFDASQDFEKKLPSLPAQQLNLVHERMSFHPTQQLTCVQGKALLSKTDNDRAVSSPSNNSNGMSKTMSAPPKVPPALPNNCTSPKLSTKTSQQRKTQSFSVRSASRLHTPTLIDSNSGSELKCNNEKSQIAEQELFSTALLPALQIAKRSHDSSETSNLPGPSKFLTYQHPETTSSDEDFDIMHFSPEIISLIECSDIFDSPSKLLDGRISPGLKDPATPLLLQEQHQSPVSPQKDTALTGATSTVLRKRKSRMRVNGKSYENKDILPLQRKRKLSKCICCDKSMVSKRCYTPSKKQGLCKFDDEKLPTKNTAGSNRRKVKIARRGSNPVKQKIQKRNAAPNKTASEPCTSVVISHLSSKTNASSTLQNKTHYCSVNKQSGSNVCKSKTNTCLTNLRRPLLEGLFNEVRASVVDKDECATTQAK